MARCQVSKAIKAWLPTPAAQGIGILYGCCKGNASAELNTELEQIVKVLAAGHDGSPVVLQHCQADV